MKGMYDLQLAISNLCVESGLPLEAIYYVLNVLFKDVSSDFFQAKERLREKEKESEKNGDTTTEMAME